MNLTEVLDGTAAVVSLVKIPVNPTYFITIANPIPPIDKDKVSFDSFQDVSPFSHPVVYVEYSKDSQVVCHLTKNTEYRIQFEEDEEMFCKGQNYDDPVTPNR